MKKPLSTVLSFVLSATLVFGLTPSAALATSTAVQGAADVAAAAQAETQTEISAVGGEATPDDAAVDGSAASDSAAVGTDAAVAVAAQNAVATAATAAANEPAGSSSADAEPELQYAEANGFENFGVDSAADPASAVTADGATATSNVTALYNLVCNGYESAATEVDTTNLNCTVGDFEEAMTLITANPEYYWATSYWGYSYYDTDKDGAADDDEIIASIKLYYCVDTASLATAKANMEAKISEALSWVDFDSMTQFQAVQALHDYLVRNCAYNTSLVSGTSPTETTSYSAYGALVDGSCVCQGYSLAYKLLLSRLGLSCVLVMSQSMNHAWNMVQMDDGNWYHVDTTWDDPTPDQGFSAEVGHNYFLRADSTMKSSLKHYGWEAAYTTPSADYANRAYATYNGPAAASGAAGDSGTAGSADGSDPASGTGGAETSKAKAASYKNSSTATQSGVTFTVQYDDPVAGQDTTFHVTQTGGSSAAKARMDVPTYMDLDGSSESVCDPSDPYNKNGWGDYHELGDDGYDFTFNFTASGQYHMIFYFMDATNGITYLRTTFFITIDDSAHPAVSTIVANAVAQAQSETDGSEYNMALWLHDWELKQLDYDYSYNYCSAESGLTRGKGTCESFQRIYQKLLTKAGLENARMEGNGHTWNAVKIDGNWCQVDVNWDDVDYSSSYGFDSTHLYFGLTDELMAKAHSAHAATYQADGYAYRSTDLSNNYFVRNGQAAEWADAYAERIQAQLDAKAASFTIASDNASLPPSISGIQNAIVAYAINQKEWKASDGSRATLTATSNVQTQSSTSWTANYDFTAEYATVQTQLTKAMFTVDTSSATYTGNAITKSIATAGLTEGTDYIVAYENNVNAGTATIAITGVGSYAGALTYSFAINKAPASYTVPTGLTATYGQKLADVVLPSGFSWENSNQSVGNAGSNTFTCSYAGDANHYGASGIAVAVKVSEAKVETQTVYRMYNPITSEHLFTTNVYEYDSLVAHGWSKEGVACSAPKSGSVGVYRLYNPGLGSEMKMSHHYTTNYYEAKTLVENYGWSWDYNGKPIFYSAQGSAGALTGASPVYRLYNGGLSAHMYTLSSYENDSLIKYHGWSGEGVGFYAYPVS